jgi:hypothetical protein
VAAYGRGAYAGSARRSLATTISTRGASTQTDKDVVAASARADAESYINNLRIGEELIINEIADRIRNADSRILDVGEPNRQIPDIYIWRSRSDEMRYSRSLIGNYTPRLGERVCVETSIAEAVRVTVR